MAQEFSIQGADRPFTVEVLEEKSGALIKQKNCVINAGNTKENIGSAQAAEKKQESTIGLMTLNGGA